MKTNDICDFSMFDVLVETPHTLRHQINHHHHHQQQQQQQYHY